MLIYKNYFTTKAIILQLCKYRIKHAKSVHKYHLLRDVSLHSHSSSLLEKKRNLPPDLKDLFPSRRIWIRPSLELRKKINDTQKIRIISLYKTIVTIHLKILHGEISAPPWYIKLQSLISNIQKRAAIPEFEYLKTPVIKPIKKENKRSCKICRPISIYDLEDRIIIGFTAKYLTDLFDTQLHNCSYAFRSNKVAALRTHHDTIKQILAYKEIRQKREIFAAEADLEKFFDTINHKIILESLEKFISAVEKESQIVDSNAIKIFQQYLASYTFNKDVYTKSETNYFIPFGIPGGKFEWPVESLIKIYPDLDNENIGIPQGGALSCLIANMVLHEVDKQVDSNPKDLDLLYLRFCDDMVILHTDKDLCTAALNRYEESLESLGLLMHKPEFILKYDNSFWKKKSKRPYKWAAKSLIPNNVPWLGFVGYQIRYDGTIRVRKKSLEKEALKQKSEMFEVLKALNLTKHTSSQINENSRKSKKQQLFALENRLISMSVGRVKLYNYKTARNGLCWTNGFQCLSMNAVSKTQCKFLDQSRRRNLKAFGKHLSKLHKQTENRDEGLKKIYFGHPFSYHGFLKK